MLGRAHATRGEHFLSIAAFEAALEMASTGRFLSSALLTIRARALAGKRAGGSGGHWSEEAAGHRLSEALGRMELREEDRAALLNIE